MKKWVERLKAFNDFIERIPVLGYCIREYNKGVAQTMSDLKSSLRESRQEMKIAWNKLIQG